MNSRRHRARRRRGNFLEALGPGISWAMRRAGDSFMAEPGAFERYREQRIATGIAASQLKTPHAVPDPGFLRREFQHEIISHIAAEDH